MFKEKENYFFIEEFEKYGIKAVYSKKNAGNMSDYCNMEGQKEGTQEKNRKRLLKELNIENKKIVMLHYHRPLRYTHKNDRDRKSVV